VIGVFPRILFFEVVFVRKCKKQAAILTLNRAQLLFELSYVFRFKERQFMPPLILS
jgi:hypothetical protein